MYNTVLFDLDGTLTDPGPGITRSVAYALKKHGILVDDLTTLYPFIGPPLADSFVKYYGFKKEDAPQLISEYREYFAVKGIFENEVYPGIIDLLSSLKAAGKTLVIATSKPEDFAVKIAEHFGLLPYFTLIAGASMDETRVEKADVIAYALEKLPGAKKETSVMIGDREHDIKGGKANGLDTIGVLYGYGSRKELAEAGATHIAESPSSILSLI